MYVWTFFNVMHDRVKHNIIKEVWATTYADLHWYLCTLHKKLMFSIKKFLKNFLTLSIPIPGKEKKINLNFNFHTSLWCLKRFYEGL